MKPNQALLGLLCVCTTSVLANVQTQCVDVEKAQVASLFDRWNSSLQTGDPAKVATNYAPHAVLLPTLSNQVRHTDAQRQDYFEHFLAKQPIGHIDHRTIFIGCQSAIDTGTYTFTFADQSQVAARYTFTYVWQDGHWLISSHHSSAMPEPIPTNSSPRPNRRT